MQLKDADELKRAMERMLCTGKEPDKERYTYDVVCCVIDEAPTVDAEPVRHAKWEYKYYPTIWYGPGEPPEWVCSECEDRAYNTYDYCPNCGASMDGEAE